MWRQGRYAVVLADVHMPEMDGYQMTAQIRAVSSRLRARTPIVALTAAALKGEAERCLAAGMDDYLVKPVSLDSALRRPGTLADAGDDRHIGRDCAGLPSTAVVLDMWVEGRRGGAPRPVWRKFSRSASESRHDIETAMAAGDLAGTGGRGAPAQGQRAGGRRPARSAMRRQTLERAAKAGDRAACQDGLGPLAVEVQRAQAEIGAFGGPAFRRRYVQRIRQPASQASPLRIRLAACRT